MKNKIYIILSIALFSIIVSIVDAFIKPNYFIKILVKIVFFLLLPCVYYIFNKDEKKELNKILKFKNNKILSSILLGIVIYIVIVGGYLLTRNIIDYSNVIVNLENSMGINKYNFIYVSLYISLLNSFLEEFFFRGFGFVTLKKYVSKEFSYLYSSIFFSLYHAGMMIGSFDILLYILLLIALVCGGCLFNYLNEKNNNIYHSWFVHVFANFGINTVGFILFNL